VSADGQVYSSDAEGLQWTPANTGGVVVRALLTPIGDRLAGIVEADDTRYFAVADKQADGALAWTIGEPTPAAFPQANFSTTHFTQTTGPEKYLLMGEAAPADTLSYPWFTYDGLSWADMSTSSVAHLPPMTAPTILYYADHIYAFGEDLTTMYTSATGIIWDTVTKDVLLPTLPDTPAAYSTTIDEQQYIWITLASPDYAFKGRINKLGFERQ
jgi:hypothetical protein